MALWYEIAASTPPELVETVSDIMRGVSPGGITVEEPVDILGPEMGFRVRPGDPVLVRAYLPASELGAVLTEDLRRAMESYPQVELTARPVHEEDWSVSWREFFGVVDYGGRIVVVPSWIDEPQDAAKLAIRLDPGQAFGTGHHETTRLCLAALESHVRPGDRVLDVGTGSGILAIAAVLLGAARVEAIDIDPVAAEVARANCAVNGVSERVSIAHGQLAPFPDPRFDLVVANISTDANIGLADVFGSALAPGGRLLLSGILAGHVPRVREAMTGEGFGLVALRFERDWSLLEFVRG